MKSTWSKEHTASTLCAILALIFLPVLLGCILAPHLYMGLIHLGRAAPAFDSLRNIEFVSVLNRVVLLAGGILGWWLYKRLQMSHLKDLGIVPLSKHQVGSMLFTWITGVVTVFLWGFLALRFSKTLLFNEGSLTWGAAFEALLAGWIVAFIEELFFRGVLAGIVHRLMSVDMTALLVGIVFSLVHFAEPEPFLSVAHADWYTGLSMLQHAFTLHDFLHGRIFMMLSLFFLGSGLIYLRYAYDSIWVPVGMHAGWVLALKICSFQSLGGAMRVSFWHTQGDLLRGWGLVLLALSFVLISRKLYQRKKRKPHVAGSS